MELKKPTRRKILDGLGATVSVSAFSDVSNANPLTELGMPAPIPPKGDVRFHFYRFNEEMKRAHPDFHPSADLSAFQRGKFIIMNFIDGTEPHRHRSIVQMRFLRTAANRITPIISPKEVLLADIVVRDEDGMPVYVSDYEVLYAENRIGREFRNEERRILPYGIAYSSSLRFPELGIQKLVDFSVSALHPPDAQARKNLIYIGAILTKKARNVNPDRIDPSNIDVPNKNP